MLHCSVKSFFIEFLDYTLRSNVFLYSTLATRIIENTQETHSYGTVSNRDV